MAKDIELLAGADLTDFVAVIRSAMAPKGALVKKTANLTGQNVTTLTAVTYDTEVYDTSSCHDAVSNTSRLVVPSGWSWVRVSARTRVTNVTAETGIVGAIYKNGATFSGFPQAVHAEQLTTTDFTITSGPLQVTGGTDYFEHMIQAISDTSIDILSDGWFCIELLA